MSWPETRRRADLELSFGTGHGADASEAQTPLHQGGATEVDRSVAQTLDMLATSAKDMEGMSSAQARSAILLATPLSLFIHWKFPALPPWACDCPRARHSVCAGLYKGSRAGGAL